MTYQPGIPTGNVPLNQDYLNIKGNFTQLNTQFQVDHVPLTSTSGSPSNGYHTVVHFVKQTSAPATIANIGQLYTLGTAPDLIYKSGTGVITQLTGSALVNIATNGTVFLPGGLVMKWGIVNGLVANTPTVVPLGFATNCFNVQLSYISKVGGTTNTQTLSVVTGTVSNVSFSYNSTQGTSAYVGFYWVALGN